jgi:hypothetical protein
MRRFRRVLLGAALAAALVAALAACHKWHDDDDDDVAITSQTLTTLRNACIVQGTVENRGDHTVRVFLTFRALDRDDDRIGTAEAEVRDLPRDSSRSFESTRFREFDGDLIPCDRIARVRRDQAVFRD